MTVLHSRSQTDVVVDEIKRMITNGKLGAGARVPIEKDLAGELGKSCETFNPCGPFLASADELGDLRSLGMRLRVNGVLQQSGSTSTMIFDVNHIVWYLSQFMVLRPGDIINTGTPAGVALGRPDPKPYLRAGDVVTLEIDGLGRARQEVRQA